MGSCCSSLVLASRPRRESADKQELPTGLDLRRFVWPIAFPDDEFDEAAREPRTCMPSHATRTAPFGGELPRQAHGWCRAHTGFLPTVVFDTVANDLHAQRG